MLSHADSELAQRDAALRRGLRLLFDDVAFCRALQLQMPDVEISNARAHYVRYKPGTNCLVAYRVKIDNKERDVYAKAYTEADQEKLFRGRASTEAEISRARGRLVLANHNVAVSIFPTDRKLKSLARLGNAERTKKLLRSLLPAQDELSNGVIEKLQYKPERRFAAKIVSAHGDAAALLKIYDDDAFYCARATATAFQSAEHLRVPRLLGTSEHSRAIAFEWASGQALNEISNTPGVEASINRVGDALGELHLQEPRRLRHVYPAEQTSALDKAVSALFYLLPSQAAAAKALALRLSTCLMRPDRLLRPIHGDFYSNQILLIGDVVTILDMDEAVWGDPLSDLGNFMAHVESEALRLGLQGSTVDDVREALVDGYCGKVGCNIQPQLLANHTSAALLKLTHDPFRLRQQDWPAQVAKLIQRAAEISTAPLSPTCSTVTSVSDPFYAAQDAAMPFLKRALDPVEVLRYLRRALKTHNVFRGQIDLQAIRVVRHKPSRRCLIEYDLFVNGACRFEKLLTVIGKVRAHGVDGRCFRLMQSLRAAGFDENSLDGIAVPEPLAVIPELNMWLQRKAPGTAASALLAEPVGIEASRRVAEAVVKLQRSEVAMKRLYNVATELRVLHERLSLIAMERPQWRNRLGRLIDACRQLSKSLPEVSPVPAHRDFYPDQVIVDGDHLYLIDFDLSAFADPGLDAGNFLAHVTEQSLRESGNATTLIEVERELEGRFVEASGEHVRPSVRAYVMLTLVRHIYISTLFADRRPFTEAILELCEQRLNVSRRMTPCELQPTSNFEGVRYATDNL